MEENKSDDFDLLLEHFFKLQNEEKKKEQSMAMMKKMQKISESIIPKYNTDSKILENWENFIKKEKLTQEQKEKLFSKEIKTELLKKYKEKISDFNDLLMMSIYETENDKKARLIKAYENEGFLLTDAKNRVEMDFFLERNYDYFLNSRNELSFMEKNIGTEEFEKMLNREKILMYKKQIKSLSNQEEEELFSILRKKKIPYKIKETDRKTSFVKISQNNDLKEKELMERKHLRRQFLKSQGYTEQQIEEELKKIK